MPKHGSGRGDQAGWNSQSKLRGHEFGGSSGARLAERSADVRFMIAFVRLSLLAIPLKERAGGEQVTLGTRQAGTGRALE